MLPQEDKTWLRAQEYCTLRGGQLAKLTSANEYEKFIAFIWNLDKSIEVWIGLNDQEYERNNFKDAWVWADGVRAFYTNWEANKPNNHNGNEDCVKVWRVGAGSYWDDDDCHKQLRYVCSRASCPGR